MSCKKRVHGGALHKSEEPYQRDYRRKLEAAKRKIEAAERKIEAAEAKVKNDKLFSKKVSNAVGNIAKNIRQTATNITQSLRQKKNNTIAEPNIDAFYPNK